MFVLDTNVLSAVMGSHPVAEVAAWVAARPEEQLFTTALCQAEVLAGVEILSEGRRRRTLEVATKTIFAAAFDGRILPFDQKSAKYYAEIYAVRKRMGKPTSTTDLMIAAIARSVGASR
jgi:predicted nucleic acid-binding protein